MPPKRRRNSVEVAQPSRAKRAKFVLDDVSLPDTTVQGVVLVSGGGETGQLGLGVDIMEKMRPVVVETESPIVDCKGGGMHSACLTSTGKVLTFGCNDEGALGRKTAHDNDLDFTPDYVDLPGKVKQITVGDSHSTALLEDGRVYVWGVFRDSHGTMGKAGSSQELFEPVQIMEDEEIVKIASGTDHLVLLTKKGEVFTCGSPEQGQLGRVTKRSSSRKARAGIGKEVLECLLNPAKIYTKPTLKLHFDDIWTGLSSTFCKVAGKNKIYVFGLNNYHQLGLDKEEMHFMPALSEDFSKYEWETIQGGLHHTLGLTKDGKVYVIGRKEYGRLGLGEDSEDALQLQQVTALKDKQVVSISGSIATSFAVTKQGELYAWGMGNSGQLGTGSEDDCWEPTLVKSKQLQDKLVFRVSGGGQHLLLLANTNNNNKNNNNNNKKK